MLRFETSVIINAPVEEIFAYLTAPERTPDYWAGVEAVKDVQRMPDGRFSYTSVSRMLGMRIESRSEVVEIVPYERMVGKGHNALMELTHRAWFDRMEGDKTRARAVNEYRFRGGPLAKLAEIVLARYLKHASEMTSQALKARVEANTLQPAPG